MPSEADRLVEEAILVKLQHLTYHPRPMSRLDVLRKKIDLIDKRLLQLISSRGMVAGEIGRIKQDKGRAIFVPEREQTILTRLLKLNKGPFKNESIQAIFKEIISATRALEAPLRAAYLGPEATFTHVAATKLFGSSADLIPVASIAAIFEKVEKQEADFGVVPIENSTEGVVNHTLDMFIDAPLKICAEIIVRVEHNLLSQETDLAKINTVYSHPHALAQCRQYIVSHLPHAVLKEAASTADAVRLVKSRRGSAAIASALSSHIYSVPMLAKKIEDQRQNFTRFLVVGNSEAGRSGRDKTSIIFGIKDEVGALYKVLGIFSKLGVNLTKIESRPLKSRAWEYMFFADLDGHCDDARIKRAIAGIQRHCRFFQWLGSYPRC